jgi:hypothetical protein
MRIDKAYKGVSDKSVVLWDSHMCDGPRPRIGEQYLMYTARTGPGACRGGDVHAAGTSAMRVKISHS